VPWFFPAVVKLTPEILAKSMNLSFYMFCRAHGKKSMPAGAHTGTAPASTGQKSASTEPISATPETVSGTPEMKKGTPKMKI
jgi:hypothetical protein